MYYLVNSIIIIVVGFCTGITVPYKNICNLKISFYKEREKSNEKIGKNCCI